MLKTQAIIIADTSCLILLDKIGELKLLQALFGEITITKEVTAEFKKSLPSYFKIESPINKIYQKILESTLDKGEASAIALAIEHDNSLLIIDDLKGRKLAERFGIKITGTLGVIIEAKLKNHISSIKPILEKVKATDFRLTAALEKRMLEKSNEEY